MEQSPRRIPKRRRGAPLACVALAALLGPAMLTACGEDRVEPIESERFPSSSTIDPIDAEPHSDGGVSSR